MNKMFFGLLLLISSITVQAEVYEIKAKNNATSGGAGVLVSGINFGDAFTVSANPLDLWSAGALPRWSNADGLQGDVFSTGVADPSGDRPTNKKDAGTLIGTAYGAWMQGGLTAPYGALVGEWGNTVGQYFLIGTQYSGVALDSQLKLFYFDSSRLDNKGSILVDVTVSAVPEIDSYVMFLMGLSIMYMNIRRNRPLAVKI